MNKLYKIKTPNVYPVFFSYCGQKLFKEKPQEEEKNPLFVK